MVMWLNAIKTVDGGKEGRKKKKEIETVNDGGWKRDLTIYQHIGWTG